MKLYSYDPLNGEIFVDSMTLSEIGIDKPEQFYGDYEINKIDIDNCLNCKLNQKQCDMYCSRLSNFERNHLSKRQKSYQMNKYGNYFK